MKKLLPLVFTLPFLSISCNTNKTETISFYQVPLACGAAPEIGCGSRIKPLFIETEKETNIKESWTNRKGTVIAIVWSRNENEELIQALFAKKDIEAKLISNPEELTKASADFRKKRKWLKGMEVDSLSLQEAGVIAESATALAKDEGLINKQEAALIKAEIEKYMKKELVMVRTYKQLKSFDTDMKWKQNGYEVYVKHIGIDRAEKVRDLYMAYNKKQMQKELCCDKDKLTSTITCPHCGFKKQETMPSDVCQLAYDCTKCKNKILAKEDDCCVFCSYGSVKCPSMQ